MADDKTHESKAAKPLAPDAQVIPLSRFRAEVARARTRPLADKLLERDDLARYLPTLPVQEVFYAIKEIGLHDATELVANSTPEQVQGFFDLDVWQKDRFVDERAAPWLDALIDAGPAKLARMVDNVDQELIALYLQRNARVYDLEQEAPAEDLEGALYPTPDGFYLLEILAGGEAGKRVERFIDWLYRADMSIARRIIMAARWELPSDLEEHAYRWRSGRMADLGYVDYFEALEVYRYLDPESVKVGEGSAEAPSDGGGLPSEFLATFDGRSLLARALGQAGADELDRLRGALLLLVNRVMSADQVEPGDMEAARVTLDRTAHHVELGLELLSRGDEVRAAEALATVSLTRIFRVGHSLTAKLERAADALVAEAWVTTKPGALTLLDWREAEIVTALHTTSPGFPRVLDAREARAASVTPGTRPFRNLGEIAQAAQALAEIAQIGEIVRAGLGVEPRLLDASRMQGTLPGPEHITFVGILASLAANVLLDRPPALVPLERPDLDLLRETALEAKRLRPSARLRVERAFAARFAEREYETPPIYDRLLDRALEQLVEGLLVSAERNKGAAGLFLRIAPAS